MKPKSLIAAFSITAILLSLFVLSVPAKAADSTILGISSLVDANTTLGVLEINQSKLSGTIKSLYIEQAATRTDDFDTGWYLKEEEQEYSEDALTVIQNSIEKNKTASALTFSNGIQDDITFIEMTESDFNTVLNNLKETSLFKQSSYKNTGLYSLEYNSTLINHNDTRKGKQLRAELLHEASEIWNLYSFMYYKGYLVKSATPDGLKLVLDTTSPLSENSSFREIATQLDSSAAFNLFYDMREVKEEMNSTVINPLAIEMTNGDIFQDSALMMNAYKAFGISASQTTKGFEFDMYVTQDAGQIKKLGYDFSNTPDPTLYKYMPNGTPIVYTDGSTSEKNAAKSAKVVSTLLEEISPEFAKLIEDSMGTETALLVEAPPTGNLIPQITFLAKTSGETVEEIRANLSTAADALWENLKENQSVQIIDVNNLIITEAGNSTSFSRSTVTIDGAEAYKFTGNITPKTSKNPYAVVWPRRVFEFSLTFGLTNNDILLVSTNIDIENKYKGDLSNNTKLGKYLKTDRASLVYLNAPNLLDYFSSLMKIMDENSRTDMQYQNNKVVIDELKDIFEEIVFTSKISNSLIEINAELKVDVPSVTELMEKFSKATFFDISDVIANSNKEFSDVNVNDWYGDTVYKMVSTGIINGNTDGTFTPNKTMTKAEFIKIMMKVLEKSGKFSPYEVGVYSRDDDWGKFSDVPEYSWFEESVYSAYNLKLVNGFSKELFKPNDQLRRDSAAKIIANAIRKYKPEYVMPINTSERIFKDVSAKTTSVEDIILLNKLGILKGDPAGYFRPAKILTKAEGTKILNDLWTILSR